ncbi:MAG TPA: hypothetical protein VHM27_07350 [Rhizomicrobium sp.]|nr:hypothetical protein [Rhizomicrobium sp.]
MRLVLLLLALFWCAPARAAEADEACASLTRQMEARPVGAMFLPSYPTVKDGPLKDAAYLYDNAVAAVALVGCGNTDQARRIGDAILFALNNDRFWKDGRLRNAYLAGRVAASPVKLVGWWEAKQNVWAEDRYQVSSDSGNMAWAALALLAVHQASGDTKYRDGAARIGHWLLQRQSGKGFIGGALGHEPKPEILTWKSTEHNTDIAAAFAGLARATGDKAWTARARSAEQFVESMWLADCRCFATGTGRDGVTPNKLVALDAQLWPLMALDGMQARHGEAAKTAAQKLGQSNGLAYSDAAKGLWTEGTAQAALYFKLTGDKAAAGKYEAAVRGMRQKDGSYLASNSAELPTGFMLDTDPTQPRQYFRIPHLAALSWAVLAAKGYNPFTRASALARR